MGLQLDEPVGSNDGSVKGSRKFECPANYGAFVRGANIAVGDYPERDIFGSDDEDEDADGEKEEKKGSKEGGAPEEDDDDQDEF